MFNFEESTCARKPLGEILKRDRIWSIPVYQRRYAWKPDDVSKADPCDIFWEDVQTQYDERRKNPDAEVHPHYMSTIKVMQKGFDKFTQSTIYHVVDGQQRITTVYLCMLSLLSIVREKNLDCDDVKDQIRGCIFEDSAKKLRPANFDRKDFDNVVEMATEGAVSKRDNSPILKSYDFLRDRISDAIMTDKNPETAAKIFLDTFLKGLDVTIVYLSRQDDERKIFESLNTTGMPLTTFDVVRNRVFTKASEEGTEADSALFESPAWAQLENDYWKERSEGSTANGMSHIESYLTKVLTAYQRTYVENDKRRLLRHYTNFSDNFKDRKAADEVDALVKYADLYRHLDAPDSDSVKKFGDYKMFHSRVSKSRVWYPILFLASELSDQERRKIVDLLESYIIRRSVCGLTEKGYNKRVASLLENMDNDGRNFSFDELRSRLVSEDSADTDIFPDDGRVRNTSAAVNFYKSKNIGRYVLYRINNSLQKYPETEENFSKWHLDHIAPVSWYATDNWKDAFPDMSDDMSSKINSLGNITLLSSGNNKAKSNRPWREAKKTFAMSTLHINRILAKHETWDVSKIEERHRYLINKVCEIWPYGGFNL